MKLDRISSSILSTDEVREVKSSSSRFFQYPFIDKNLPFLRGGRLQRPKETEEILR